MRSGWSSHAKISKRLETNVAKALGGRRQPASGAFRDATDDITAPGLRVEQKYTDADAYRVNPDIIETVRARGAKRGEIGVLLVLFRKVRIALFVVAEKDARSLELPFGDSTKVDTKTFQLTPSWKPQTGIILPCGSYWIYTFNEVAHVTRTEVAAQVRLRW